MHQETSVLVVVLFVGLCLSEKTDESLFFTSPGEIDRLATVTRAAGLYGGKINLQNNGLSENLFEAGYHCTKAGLIKKCKADVCTIIEGSRMKELEIESMSFDPVSGDVLMKIKSIDMTHVSLLKAPLCEGTQNCLNNSLSALMFNAQSPDVISPFALYNSQVYFVRTKDEQLSRTSKLRTLELRKLAGCEMDYPLDRSMMFDVEDCSQFIAILEEEKFENFPPVVAASHLLVIPPTETHGIQFFVQLLYTKRGDDNKIVADFKLKQVLPDRKTRDVHSEPVDRNYIPYEINHVGGMSCRDDLLCWSAFDCIYCGKWDGYTVTDIQMKLQKTQANEVCKAAPGETILANIVTGVAIADSKSGDLYFGCIAQIPSTGGAVLLSHDNGKIELTSIRSRHDGYQQRVFAGSMFLTDKCASGYGSAYRAVISGVTSLHGQFIPLQLTYFCIFCVVFHMIGALY